MTDASDTQGGMQRVEALFHEAAGRSAAERCAFLDEACAGDADLRRKVERLLALDEADGGLLDSAPWKRDRAAHVGPVRPEPIDELNARVGRYRLLKQCGEGGMGTVWLAERADQQFEKQFAIKIVKRGMDTDDILRRFRNERQLLAGFEHPDIARLIDGGATEDGRPYLVMEYVQGVPIDQYCNDHALDVRSRLQLFRRVCMAVHEAHKNLIVHRDLKPSNILITQDGNPKLLDFGIAKLMEPSGQPVVTATGLRMMTPRYASPEQIRGDAITTASDVYSLGVILYELLTGCRPYDMQTESRPEMERVVLNQEPTRPSVIVNRTRGRGDDSTTSRSTYGLSEVNMRRVSRLLAGDLDTIVLAALRKEADRRYGSAEKLAADIGRYLRDDPITARPDTWRYRSSKFVRRNRTGVVAAAMLMVAILGGLVASLILYQEAESARGLAVRQREQAEWNAYVANISAAAGAVTDLYYPRQAKEHLDAAPERYRGWEWDYLASRVDRSLVDMESATREVRKSRIAWQPGGWLLACQEGEARDSVRVYDGRNGDRVADLGTVRGAPLNSIAFSPDGQRLATIGHKGQFTSWRIDGQVFQRDVHQKLGSALNSFRFNCDGSVVFVRHQRGSVQAFTFGDDRLVPLWTYRSDETERVNLSNTVDSDVLVIGTSSRLVVVDARSGEVLRSTDVGGRPGPIRVVDDQLIMAVVDDDVLTWDLATLQLIERVRLRTSGGLALARFFPDPQYIGFQPRLAHHTALGDLKEARIETSYFGFREQGIVQDLQFSDDGERVAVSAMTGALETWDVSGTPTVRHLRWLHGDPVVNEHFTSIDSLADGSLIVAGSQGGVSLWEPRTGIRLSAYRKKEQGIVQSVRLRPDGARIAATSNGSLDVWDVETGQILWSIAGASRHLNSIDASPDGEHLAFVEPSTKGGVVHLCDWETGEIVRTYPRPQHGARSVAFSPDGRYLACGTGGGKPRDSRVVIWEVATGRVVQQFAGVEKIVESVAWSPDSSMVAACGYRRAAWVWSLETGEQLSRLDFGVGVWRCRSVSFTPDGKRLIVTNSSDTLRVCDVEHSEEILRLGFVSDDFEVTMPDNQSWLAVAARWKITIWDTAAPAERVVGEVVRRRYHETPDDWPTILQRLESDRWLTDSQRADALALGRRIHAYRSVPD